MISVSIVALFLSGAAIYFNFFHEKLDGGIIINEFTFDGNGGRIGVVIVNTGNRPILITSGTLYLYKKTGSSFTTYDVLGFNPNGEPYIPTGGHWGCFPINQSSSPPVAVEPSKTLVYEANFNVSQQTISQMREIVSDQKEINSKITFAFAVCIMYNNGQRRVAETHKIQVLFGNEPNRRSMSVPNKIIKFEPISSISAI